MQHTAALAQAYSDSINLTVYYPCGSSNILKLSGNAPSLERFIQQLDSVWRSYAITPVSLHVTSSASPEGSVERNLTLARHRSRSLLDYLNHHSETFQRVTAATECRTYEQLTNHQLGKTPPSAYPSLRHTRLTLLLKGERTDSTEAGGQPSHDDKTVTQTVEAESAPTTKEAVPTPSQQPCCRKAVRRPVLFVKTNLLYDLITFVNASVEVPLTKRLTVEGTLVYPWWRSTAKHKTVHLRYVAVAPRYYFGNPREPYTSYFAGLSVGSGIYDLQWTRRGVQGSLWHVSPMVGYSHRIAKRWKMEYSAAIGFIHTKYTKYTQTAGTPYGEIKVRDYPWVSKTLNTVLPTSLNVSIAYTLYNTRYTQHDGR